MMFLYILQSSLNKSYYIGITKNLEKRIIEHNKGKVYSTKAKEPWVLVYKKEYGTRSEAFKREKYLKSLKSRKVIEKLFKSPSSSLV